MKLPEPGRTHIGKELRNWQGDTYHNNLYIGQAKEWSRAGLLYTLDELEEKFSGIFDDPTLPLVLDIGCYMGVTVIELSKFNKRINVLGIDIKYKRVVKSCHKIKAEGLRNCKIAICDAGEIVSILPVNSIFGVFIFFPDPWRKHKQQKHRLLTPQFLEKIHAKLEKEGFLWFKTDNKKYFDAVIGNIKKSNFTITDVLPGTIADREYKTLFEEMFIRQKESIYQVIIRKDNG
jgi:tRNA (guanine-N7-)-methyltransferase